MSLGLELMPVLPDLPPPVLRTRYVALGDAERRLLLGALGNGNRPRALGHCAVLELVDAGDTKLPPGGLFVPFSRLPCGNSRCPFCRPPRESILGLHEDGYGSGYVTTPPEHLIPMYAGLGPLGLLADPLATLLESLAPILENRKGSVWVHGRTIEARLAAFLARDAGWEVIPVDRRGAFEVRGVRVRSLSDATAEIRRGAPPPSVVVDLSGDLVPADALTNSLCPGGTLVSKSIPGRLVPGSHLRLVSPAALRRETIAAAIERIGGWSVGRGLSELLGPALPLEAYWDLFLDAPFSLPFIDLGPRS